MKADLHMHSYYSDGKFSPEELIKKCREANLDIIALTDHETVKGVPEAIKAGRALGIKIIPAVELSSDFQGREHHVLGYFIDYQSERLNHFLAHQRKSREERIQKIVNKLKSLGFALEFSEVMSLIKDSVCRSHVCDAVFLRQTENLSLLERYKVKTIGDFVKVFLKEDGLAHISGRRPYIREVIDLIAEAGGISVLAHPFWRVDGIGDIEKKFYQLRKFGLDGVEVGYPYHNEARVRGLHRLAGEFSMIESAGSDSHLSLSSFETYGIEINFPFDRRNT